MNEYTYFDSGELHRLASSILEGSGMSGEDAKIGADVLLYADLRGIDSHGVAHLSAHQSYVKGLKNGNVNPYPNLKTISESPTIALLDGDGGLGPVLGHRAMEKAIEKARASGVGLVGVSNSRHYGSAGYYAEMALPHDMIGISMTQASPAVLPTFGGKRKLGTNAMSFAIPAGEEPSYVLDMATSAVAVGKLELARRKSEEIPVGWAVDSEGRDTTDPNDYWNGGALVPLGSMPELSSHKGFGLGMLVDILCGVLTGVGFGATMSREKRAVGHFLGAFRVDGFRPVAEFKSMMDEMIRDMRSTPRINDEQPVLIPGQKEHEIRQERLRDGVPLHAEVVEALQAFAEEFGIDFPSSKPTPIGAGYNGSE